MKLIYIAFISLFFILSGCSSKKYFEPKAVAGTVVPNGSTITPIVDVTRNGATLADGRVITKKEGLINSGKLPSGFRFVNENDSDFLATNIYGDLYLISKSDFSIKQKLKFKKQIITATISASNLAMVDADNEILLYDLINNKLLYKEKLHESVAVDTRVANPKFLNDLLFYPTLDGRLLIMNIYQKRILRDIAISDRAVFNNVIFLQGDSTNLIAATSSKIVSISPSSIKNYRTSVKDILYSGGQLYVFSKDGTIKLLDSNLNKINTLNVPYAIFSGVYDAGNVIYVAEKNGYLLKLQKDLSSYIVKELPSKIEQPVFFAKGKLFIGDKFITLK